MSFIHPHWFKFSTNSQKSIANNFGFRLVPSVCLFSLWHLVYSSPSLARVPVGVYLAQATKQESNSSIKILFVNPAVGNDGNGNGTETAPFKTITHALRQAKPNSVILLSVGIYSTTTGENFPLILKPGVTIQGNPRTRGENIIIQGGGTFLSPTAASQNVAIVGASNAGVTGVTVTNRNQRGYGLWIESSSPVVVDNTFTGNLHDGISVNGNSAPLIRSNYLFENGGNGITIYGTSQPEVRDNVLSKTGFGISVTQNAAPKLIGNRISHNKEGVVVEGNAQPILRNNIINNNDRNGLIAIAQSRPNLGTAGEPGGNTFRNNGQFDIDNKTSQQIITAYGNQLSNRLQGRIDLGGQSSDLSRRQELPTQNSNQNTNVELISQSRSTDNQQPPRISISASQSPSTKSSIAASSFPVPSSLSNQRTSSASSFPVPSSLSNQSTSSASSFPVPSSLSNQSTSSISNSSTFKAPTTSSNSSYNPTSASTISRPSSTLTSPAISTPKPSNSEVSQLPTNSSSVSIPVPSPALNSPQRPGEIPNSRNFSNSPQTKPAERTSKPAQSSAIRRLGQAWAEKFKLPNPSGTLPTLEAQNNNRELDLLRVPSQKIPLGNVNERGSSDDRNSLPNANNSALPNSPGPINSNRNLNTTMRYRVVVEANQSAEQDIVRSIVPDAFRTVTNGRVMLQVGIYSDRAYAEEMLQTINGKGLRAKIEELN